MQGVTTAIVAFIFLCLAIPSLIKNKSQYYAAFIAVVAVIFLDAVAHVFPESAQSIKAVCYVLAGFIQIIAVVMLFLATGGLTFRELSGDMIEVLRRGEDKKEVIIPLSDEAKQKIRAAQEASERRVKQDEQAPKVYTIDDPSPSAPANPPAPPAKPPDNGPLPLA
ncbi:MAG: hypothetical protein ABSB42_14675 [Tepidisphaeraceae bacterium]|jgi:hypothetical protein